MTKTLILLVLLLVSPMSIHADYALVATSASGERALAVCRESHFAAVTEIWVEGADGSRQRLGLLIGGVEAIGWSDGGDAVLCREVPLSIPLFGKAFADQAILPLVAPKIWRIPRSGGAIRPMDMDPAPDLGGIADTTARLTQPPQEEVTAALGGVSQALTKVAGASSAMNRWTFEQAGYLLEQAASEFKRLPGRHRKSGLFKAHCEAYAQAVKDRAALVDRESYALVCREHMGLIAELLDDYKQAHGGRIPADLSALKKW